MVVCGWDVLVDVQGKAATCEPNEVQGWTRLWPIMTRQTQHSSQTVFFTVQPNQAHTTSLYIVNVVLCTEYVSRYMYSLYGILVGHLQISVQYSVQHVQRTVLYCTVRYSGHSVGSLTSSAGDPLAESESVGQGPLLGPAPASHTTLSIGRHCDDAAFSAAATIMSAPKLRWRPLTP